MCINKRSLLNQGWRPGNIYTPRYIEVPCNHCWQCSLSRINDITFRILQDIECGDCPSSFVTLSYSDLFLPYIVYCSKSGNSVKVSCWNREHIKRYIKRIRRKLSYYFGIEEKALKYFLTCERGSADEYISDTGVLRKGTSRPHYHIIFYFTADKFSYPIRELPRDYFKSSFLKEYETILISFFHYLIDKEWYYGNVDHQDLVRDTVARVLYVCKYVCKDLNDPVFKISPQDVLSIIDPEFDVKSDLWYIQLKPSEPFSEKAFKWEDNWYETGDSHARYPHPIKLSSCFPRCMGSINIGMSFIENLSLDEIEAYLDGRKKVTLPSTNSSSLINLPSYYYRKICKESVQIKDGEQYDRVRVTPRGIHTLHLTHVSSNRLKIDYNNVEGLHISLVPSVVTQSVTSKFGKHIKQSKFNRYVSDFIITLRYFYYHDDLFKSYLREYSLLSQSFRTEYFDNCYSLCSADEALASVDYSSFTFQAVAKCLNSSFAQSSCFSFRKVKHLFNYIKLVQVCQYYLAHLQHLKNDKVYHDKFYSSAFDNPELFLPHFIN